MLELLELLLKISVEYIGAYILIFSSNLCEKCLFNFINVILARRCNIERNHCNKIVVSGSTKI